MTGVHDSLTLTRSDAISEVISAESFHVVLETSPPDYVEKISRYLESSAGQSRQDTVSNEPAESDSGDSLFITQKPVPEAVRSARPRYSSRSDPISPRVLEEGEDDTSSSASCGESKTDKKRRRKKYRLPKYSFPFLSGRKWKPRSTLLAVQQNTSLHHFAMGGFFKCVTELWQDNQRGDHLESSLPTVDIDGDSISPLSEEDREEDEDIKVVEKKRFVVPSKAKSRQTWCNQLKQQRGRKAGNARQETSCRRQWKTTLHKIPAKASISRVTVSSSDTENSDDGESPCRVLVERERNDERLTSDGNFLAQAPKTNGRLTRQKTKNLFQQKAREEELCNDRDATVCEPHKLQRSPRQDTQKGREASTTVTEPQTDVFLPDDLSQTGQAEEEPESQNLFHSLPDLISDTNTDRVCSETRVRKRKKKKKDKGDDESVEEEKGQSQEEPEGLHAATSVNGKVEETPSLSEDNMEKPLASQTSDELEYNGNNWMENSSHDDNILRPRERDIPDSKQQKKKRKKNKSAAENVRQEVEGNSESVVRMEDSVFSVSCNVENGGKEKKKKKKKKRNVEDDEQLQPSAVAEPPIDDAEIQKKKKKRKKEERIVITEECEEEEASNRTLSLPPMSTGQLEESGNCLENTAASQETFESSYVKRKKHKRKQQSSFNEATRDGEEGVSFSNDTVTLAKSTGMSLKKKKKKKISEGVDIAHTPDENEKVENVDNTRKTKEGLEDQSAELVTKRKKKKKKKKKKKMSGISSRDISEDNVAQSDDSVSVREKEKKRTSSFLVADAEENVAQTHGEQNFTSQSVDAHVWGAGKPGVSAGNMEESNDGVSKKKKKRKRKMSVAQDSVETDHGQDFEEPNRTCQSALPETTDTGVKRKRKKKRMGNESELVTPVERLKSAADAGHSPTDEAVVLMKKKKKKKCKDEPCHVVQESPPRTKGKELTLPLVAKGKRGRSVDLSHDGSTSDQAMEILNMVEHAPPSSETPGNQALNGMREKKKKKKMKSTDNVLLEGKSLTESAELEPQENKKKEKRERSKQSAVPNIISSSPKLSETSLSKSELSSSDRIMKNKHVKVKRRLHNPSEDFLTDY
ncbi:trichohyalin-like isoform X2 [Siniperca chuatsi]|uniref:trichohyalin-like isoform X2 n=1 Tax=Siniperca chuatsi TaxID=119488 RepID=UPI001CE1C577|nr:trichohyalin-like isoform X2 [Siniperca chuatsi]